VKISTEENLAGIRTRNIPNRKLCYRRSGVYEISEPPLDTPKDEKFRISSPLTTKIVYLNCMFLFTEIPKISNTQATAGSEEGSDGAGTGRGK